MWLRASGRRTVPVDRTLRTVAHYLSHSDGLGPFDRRAIISYLAASADAVKPLTVRTRWDQLRTFCRYGLSEGLIDSDPMLGLSRPKVSPEETVRDAPAITEETIDRLLIVCPGWTEQGLRNRAIILTLWDTPLRAQELCDLLQEDVDWEALEMKVRDGKGGCRYEVVFTPETGLAIRRYLRARQGDSPALFTNRDELPLSIHALQQIIYRLSDRAEIRPRLFAHAFRHNFRRRLRILGLDDADISALMGHKTIVPTWGYARRAARELAKARLRERMGLL